MISMINSELTTDDYKRSMSRHVAFAHIHTPSISHNAQHVLAK